MKSGLLFLIPCALLIGVSCEKELTPAIENQGMPLITREIFSEDSYNEFSYNEQNLLKERKSKWVYNSYHYDGNNRLTTMDLYEDQGIYSSDWETAEAAINRTEWVSPENTQKLTTTTYKYRNQIPESKTELTISGDTQYMSAFVCDNKGRITSQEFYYAGTPSGKIVYAYDVWGNVSKEEQFLNGTLVVTMLYEYDNKHNPFKAFRQLLIPGIYTNENNIIRVTVTFIDNEYPNTKTVHVTESDYKYNDQGYPVTKNGDIRYEYK